MKKKIIIFVMLLIIIIGGLIFIYYRYEKTGQISDLKYANFSISATLNNELIEIGYKIKRDGYFYSEGKTLKGGAVLVPIPINSTYEIFSVNLENQTYYIATINILVNEPKPYRAFLEITPPGNISIFHYLNKTTKNINVTIKSDGPYSRLTYCLDWSKNFIWVRSLTHNTLSNIKIPKYVKCYETLVSLNNEDYQIILEYNDWNDLDYDLDYVEIYFFDTKIIINETVFKDFGGEDVSYSITGF